MKKPVIAILEEKKLDYSLLDVYEKASTRGVDVYHNTYNSLLTGFIAAGLEFEPDELKVMSVLLNTEYVKFELKFEEVQE